MYAGWVGWGSKQRNFFSNIGSDDHMVLVTDLKSQLRHSLHTYPLKIELKEYLMEHDEKGFKEDLLAYIAACPHSIE